MPDPNGVSLKVEERQRLTGIVAGLYDFTDLGPRGRRELLRQAGLARFVSGIDLTGTPRVVAGDLVGRLEDYGELPDRPGYHALGALLSYLLTLGELPREQASFIAGLIAKYSLVDDPAYIDRLYEEYGLTEVPIRPMVAAIPKAPLTVAAEPDFEVALTDATDVDGLEQVIHDESNFLDIHSLYGAIYSAQAVCLIEVPEGIKVGTGFLIGPDLVLTNQHVLQNVNYLESAVARFGYMEDATGVAQPGRVHRFQPGFYYSSPPEALDYALVRLEDAPLKGSATTDELSMVEMVRLGKHRGYLALAPRFIIDRERVNIVQHPDCDPMKVVMTQNYVAGDMSETRLQYVADTMGGSSGSPVLNQKWEVVALHHSGKPYPPEAVTASMKKAWKGRLRVNEGIPMKAILADLQAKKAMRYLPRT
ncbi:MAG: trypsin-like peptidase domain-containing protein [Chloroflexi bacterium]|nr:trypsin-like peptidase domain-containing protein [Chloroflexota bacterium]